MGAKSSLLRRWRNSSWQNVFTVVHAAFPYIPLSAQSNQREEEPACYTFLHMADDQSSQGQRGPGLWDQPPEFLGLHTIQAIVMTVVSFPQNAQRRVIRGG